MYKYNNDNYTTNNKNNNNTILELPHISCTDNMIMIINESYIT